MSDLTDDKLVLVPDRFGLVVCDLSLLTDDREGRTWQEMIEHAALDTVAGDVTIEKVRAFNVTGDINAYWSDVTG